MNYRKIQQVKADKIEARRREQATQDEMAKKSDQVVDMIFKLQEMITMQQAQL